MNALQSALRHMGSPLAYQSTGDLFQHVADTMRLDPDALTARLEAVPERPELKDALQRASIPSNVTVYFLAAVLL